MMTKVKPRKLPKEPKGLKLNKANLFLDRLIDLIMDGHDSGGAKGPP